MALDARDFTLPGQWAKAAFTTIPQIPMDEQSYRNAAASKALIESGQAYNIVADSALWNQILYLASGMAMEAEIYGWPRWSPLTNYDGSGSFALGTDGIPYRAMKDSGQGTEAGPKDPTDPANVGVDKYWLSLAAWLALFGDYGDGMTLEDKIAQTSKISFQMENTHSPQTSNGGTTFQVNFDTINFDETAMEEGTGAILAENAWICPKDGRYMFSLNTLTTMTQATISPSAIVIYKNDYVWQNYICSAVTRTSPGYAMYPDYTTGAANLVKGDKVRCAVGGYTNGTHSLDYAKLLGVLL